MQTLSAFQQDNAELRREVKESHERARKEMEENSRRILAAVAPPSASTKKVPARRKPARGQELIKALKTHPQKSILRVSASIKLCYFTEEEGLFQSYIRHHIECTLLAIRADVEGPADGLGPTGDKMDRVLGKLLVDKCPKLTDEQLKAYHDRTPEGIILTTTSFRYDFSRTVDHPFNADAIFVATRGFISAIEGGSYRQDRPESKLSPDVTDVHYVAACVKEHFRYMAKCYKDCSKEDWKVVYAEEVEKKARHGKQTRVSLFTYQAT